MASSLTRGRSGGCLIAAAVGLQIMHCAVPRHEVAAAINGMVVGLAASGALPGAPPKHTHVLSAPAAGLSLFLPTEEEKRHFSRSDDRWLCEATGLVGRKRAKGILSEMSCCRLSCSTCSIVLPWCNPQGVLPQVPCWSVWDLP